MPTLRTTVKAPVARDASKPPLPYTALNIVAFAFFPAALTIYAVYICIHLHSYAIDFHQEFWPAAWRVLHGLSPYDRSWQIIDKGVSFPYPALTAIVFVPFALVGRVVADVSFTIINIAVVLLTLRVLRVRDWRIYGVVMLWSPIIDAWQAANLTLLLGLGIAVVWRVRHRPVVAGLVVAVLISLKPFAWPLVVWFIATRRYTALAYTAIWGLVINVVAWGALGYGQIAHYESLTRVVTAFQYKTGYTLVALGLHLGTGHTVAYLVAVVAAVIAAGACLVIGRRGDDRSALTLAVALCLLATPVLWVHYFSLILIPLALSRPRLDGLWFVPLVLWVCPVKSAPWQVVVALTVNAVVICAAVWWPQSSDPEVTPEGDRARVAAPEHSSVPALAVK